MRRLCWALAVATVVMAALESELDRARMAVVLGGEPVEAGPVVAADEYRNI